MRIKIISIGAAAVGKSCLIKRYCEDRFVSKYIATIGIDYGVKPVTVDAADVRVNFWDLSGVSEFLEVRNEFYRDAQGALLVFDVGAKDSFECLDAWLAEAAKYGANYRDIPIALCANKTDKKRVVSEEDGRKYAAARGFSYFETSAQSGASVQEMFDSLFRAVVSKAQAAT
jgi:DnaJ family protein C protein 27